jgi:hypothetical protein
LTSAANLSRDLRDFRAIVESHLAATGVRQTTFGKEAAGFTDFVRRLRAGDDFRVSTIARVLDHIAMQEMT